MERQWGVYRGNDLPVQSVARAETLHSCKVTETLCSTAHTLHFFLHFYTHLWIRDTVIHSWNNSYNKAQFNQRGAGLRFISCFLKRRFHWTARLLRHHPGSASSVFPAISLAAAQTASESRSNFTTRMITLDFHTAITKLVSQYFFCVYKEWEMSPFYSFIWELYVK